jgi:hypothetical protein
MDLGIQLEFVFVSIVLNNELAIWDLLIFINHSISPFWQNFFLHSTRVQVLHLVLFVLVSVEWDVPLCLSWDKVVLDVASEGSFVLVFSSFQVLKVVELALLKLFYLLFLVSDDVIDLWDPFFSHLDELSRLSDL